MWIAQLSDPHLRPAGTLYKDVVDANAALAAAVAQVNALDPLPELVLLSGDLAEEGLPEEYAAAREILSALRPPLLAIPGNHDRRDAFRAAFADHAHLPATGPLHFAHRAHGPVRIVALDATVPGRHHGEAEPHLGWLDAALAEEPTRPTLVVMHHQPFLCGVPYLDAYRCLGAAALEAVILRHPQVQRVLCGHVHRAMTRRFGGTLLCTAPSTATAIALHPRADAAPASFLEPPGFLLHHWDGSAMLTHLVPLGAYPGPFAFA